MKKFLILAAVLIAVFALCACSALKAAQTPVETEAPTEVPTPVPTEVPTEAPTEAPTEVPTPKPVTAEDLLGTWTVREFRFGSSVLNAADLGMETYFEFRADGTVYCVQSTEDVYDEITMAVTFDGDRLIFRDRDGDVPGSYDRETDTILMQSDDAEVVLVRTPDAQIPQKHTTETAVSDDPAGEWELVRSNVAGAEIPVDSAESGMRVILNGDGTASVWFADEEQDGFAWTLDGETITLSIEEIETLSFAFDGQTLQLFWDEGDVPMTMIFERVEAE